METVFVFCFAFGALFTAISTVLGMAHTSVPGADLGHFGHLRHPPRLRFAGSPAAFLNASSLLAFLTWFGAAGYVALRFGGWPVLAALALAALAGTLGALVLGLFLRKVEAGEQVLDPRAFRLEGTLARVTVSVPADGAGGAGEVIFVKAGRRRSEAARSASGVAIPRDTEVVILRYERGVALVQAWDELLHR